MDDVILNAVGTLLGYLVWKLYKRVFRTARNSKELHVS
ncbi:hypothetical protein QNH15_07875 [Fictibacillus enclensis]|nr:hypothetical protein [Fictibacillus enclensis]WHY74904.1 hypothetical protein QNH15_07875 [Fictibacillus enclensis]